MLIRDKRDSMKCMNCGIEFNSTRLTARYCSAKCRVKASRLSVTPVSVTDSLSVTLEDIQPNVKIGKHEDCSQSTNATPAIVDYTYNQLVSKIDRYKADNWVGSPESIELGRRLETYTLDKLKGYWIPARIHSKYNHCG